MLPLFQGIYTYFAAATTDDFYTSIGGRFYFSSAKSGSVTKPYAVYHDLGGSPVEYYFSHTFESRNIQISLWDDGLTDSKPKSSSRILQVAEYCKEFFDLAENSISVSGWSIIKIMRDAAQPPLLFDEKRNEWMQPLRYEILLQKAR